MTTFEEVISGATQSPYMAEEMAEAAMIDNIPTTYPSSLHLGWFVTGAFHDLYECEFCESAFWVNVGRLRNMATTEEFCTVSVNSEGPHGVRFTHLDTISQYEYPTDRNEL